jgi:hypothetical protein
MERWEKQARTLPYPALKAEPVALTWERSFYPEPVSRGPRPDRVSGAVEAGRKAADRILLDLKTREFGPRPRRSGGSASSALAELFYNLFIDTLMRR